MVVTETTADLVAWQGHLRLMEAKWTDKDGHTVRFKIVDPDEELPNPFKTFTKRRGGKAGTIFYGALKPVEDEPTEGYEGNMMLAAWSDTATQGQTVTFWIEPPEAIVAMVNDEERLLFAQGHPFESYQRGGSSWMAALVELDDDGRPIEQGVRARLEAAVDALSNGGQEAEPESKVEPQPTDDAQPAQESSAGDPDEAEAPEPGNVEYPLPPPLEPSVLDGDQYRQQEMAAMAAIDEDFGFESHLDVMPSGPHMQEPPRTHNARVVTTQDPAPDPTLVHSPQKLTTAAAIMCANPLFWKWINDGPDSLWFDVKDDVDAAQWMRRKLGIESRAVLNKDPHLAQRFHDEIRRPFAEWSAHG